MSTRIRVMPLTTVLALVVAGTGVGYGPSAAAAAWPQPQVLSTPADVDALSWAPPPLTNPVPLVLGTGRTSNNLDPDTDYIVMLPDTVKTGATILRGGHNVVIIGGHIRLPTYDPTKPSADARAIYITENTGTVHIEGVFIDAVSDGQGDAIVISSPQSTVQVENVRVEGLKGAEGDGQFHCDIIQPFGGVKELRVDKLTGSSHYQGLFLPPSNGDIGNVRVKRTNLFALPELFPGAKGGFMSWISPPGSNPSGTGPFYDFSDFYVQPRDGRTLGNSVWPASNDPEHPLVVDPDGFGRWPAMSNVTGGVHTGTPPGGSYVPPGVAGLTYVSPGYDLATTASVTASSVYQGNIAQYGAGKAADGEWSDTSRWLSAEDDASPTLTLAFGPATVRAIDVYSGFGWPEVDPLSALSDFTIQARVGGAWQQLAQFTDNRAAKASWAGQVTADQVRLVITDPSRVSPDVARVYEVAVYAA